MIIKEEGKAARGYFCEVKGIEHHRARHMPVASWQRYTHNYYCTSQNSLQIWCGYSCALWLPAELKSHIIGISVRWLRTPINISHKFSPSRGCCPVRSTLWLAGGYCDGRASAAGSAWLKPVHDGKQCLNPSALAAVQEHAIKYEYLMVLSCHPL